MSKVVKFDGEFPIPSAVLKKKKKQKKKCIGLTDVFFLSSPYHWDGGFKPWTIPLEIPWNVS